MVDPDRRLGEYERFLFGIEEPVDSLTVFEMGGKMESGQAPIIEGLAHRKANLIEYRGLVNPRNYGCYDPNNPESHREVARMRLNDPGYYQLRERGTLDNRISRLEFPWDIADLPYPFEAGKFDEFHCHMITSQIVRKDDDYEDEGMPPTMDAFAAEIARLNKTGGRAYFTFQFGVGHFFGDSREPFDFSEYVQDAEKFAEAFRKQGYNIELLKYDDDVKMGLEDLNLEREMIKRPPYEFSHVAEFAHCVMIARKTA